MDYLNKKVRLEKLTDDRFEGNHPFGIDAGYVTEGIAGPLEIGEYFELFYKFRTSIVKSIISETDEEIVFKTRNSTYILSLV